jgi:putative PIN family toxin of toxin-antitoxin system
MDNKIIIDTNVFIKAFFDLDDSNDCLRLIANLDKMTVLFSQDTIGELMYIIKNCTHYLNTTEEQSLQILKSVTEIFYYGKSINTFKINESDLPNINDQTDMMFVKLAIAGNADYIITNDKKSGILDLKDQPFRTCTTKEFISYLLNKE